MCRGRGARLLSGNWTDAVNDGAGGAGDLFVVAGEPGGEVGVLGESEAGVIEAEAVDEVVGPGEDQPAPVAGGSG